MKLKFMCSIVLVSLLQHSSAQNLFQHVYRNDSLVYSISHAAQTYDNGFMMTGTVADWQLFGGGPGDIFMMRTDSAGNILWSRRWDLANDEQVFSVLATPDSGYLICGFTFGATTLSRDGFILKADDNGNISWVKRIDHNGASNTFHSVCPASSGHNIFSGRSAGGAGGQYDMYLCLADSLGTLLWGKTFGGSNWDWGWWAEQTSDGGYVMTGESQSFGIGSNDIYIVKTDSAGNKQWSKAYGSTTFEKGLWVEEIDNYYYVAGYTQGFVPGNTDAKTFLMKTDDIGNPLWFKIYGEMSTPSYVSPTADHGFVLVGSSYNLPGGFGSSDMFVIKTDSSGSVLWSRSYGGSGNDGGSFISPQNPGYLIGGITNSFVSPTVMKTYLVATDDTGYSGCNDAAYTTTVYTATPTVIIPADVTSAGYSTFTPAAAMNTPSVMYTLLCPLPSSSTEINSDKNTFSIYPNPASDAIYISSGDFQAELKSICFFNCVGQRVSVMKIIHPENEIIIDCSMLSSGLYLLEIEGTNNFRKSMKIVIDHHLDK